MPWTRCSSSARNKCRRIWTVRLLSPSKTTTSYVKEQSRSAFQSEERRISHRCGFSTSLPIAMQVMCSLPIAFGSRAATGKTSPWCHDGHVVFPQGRRSHKTPLPSGRSFHGVRFRTLVDCLQSQRGPSLERVPFDTMFCKIKMQADLDRHTLFIPASCQDNRILRQRTCKSDAHRVCGLSLEPCGDQSGSRSRFQTSSNPLSQKTWMFCFSQKKKMA